MKETINTKEDVMLLITNMMGQAIGNNYYLSSCAGIIHITAVAKGDFILK